MHDRLMRTVLFVPANRPDRFTKAIDSGADAVIIDLEDSVAPADKESARAALAAFLRDHDGPRLWVRINDGTTPWFDEDLIACRTSPAVAGIVLPKAEAAEHVYIVSGAGKPILPVIESAAGMRVMTDIAKAAGVVRLSFGMLDLMAELGTNPHTEAAQRVLDQIRFQVLMASRMHGLKAPLDGVQADFTDLDQLRAGATLARDMGFGGMLCIHPAQVDVVNQVYRPDPDSIEWARRVVAHADQTGDYAFRLDGRMVDLPLIGWARRILLSTS